jgi:hypothetical protein
VNRVYVSHGRTSHLRDNRSFSALCGFMPRLGPMWFLGTSSEHERVTAARLPLCKACEMLR